MISSNLNKEPLTKASVEALVEQALELYRKSCYYDLHKTHLHKFYEELKECSSLYAIEEALKIYAKAKDKRTGRTPHPSYFVKVALRLDVESNRLPIEVTDNIKTNWGKVI